MSRAESEAIDARPEVGEVATGARFTATGAGRIDAHKQRIGYRTEIELGGA